MNGGDINLTFYMAFYIHKRERYRNEEGQFWGQMNSYIYETVPELPGKVGTSVHLQELAKKWESEPIVTQ
jgi:hypothetical protein